MSIKSKKMFTCRLCLAIENDIQDAIPNIDLQTFF